MRYKTNQNRVWLNKTLRPQSLFTCLYQRQVGWCWLTSCCDDTIPFAVILPTPRGALFGDGDHIRSMLDRMGLASWLDPPICVKVWVAERLFLDVVNVYARSLWLNHQAAVGVLRVSVHNSLSFPVVSPMMIWSGTPPVEVFSVEKCEEYQLPLRDVAWRSKWINETYGLGNV